MMAGKGEEVVIGYNVTDLEFVKKVAGTLRDEGMSVWYADPRSDPASMGNKTQAILACMVYIPVLSAVSVEDKHLQEQLSLAYVSNSCIFPLGTTRHRFIAPKLNGGAKLILAKINWCFVLKDEDYNKNITNLIQCIRTEMKRLQNNPSSTTAPPLTSITSHGIDLRLTHGLDLGGSEGYEGSEMPDSSLLSESSDGSASLWDRHFNGQTSVKWAEFREKFLNDYGKSIEKEFGDMAEERKKLILNLMHKDVFYRGASVQRKEYEAFCSHLGETSHRFYRCVMEYLAAYMNLREIISMESSMRITTIQSLGKFRFPVIINGLVDLLRDEDANIRAVAAIALAHAGKEHKDTVKHLVELLEDEDRLVRESACLSLGFLKAGNAVDDIVDRWRNDPISTVREAAELALSKMNVPEAQRCIKVTQILSSEMSALKPKE